MSSSSTQPRRRTSHPRSKAAWKAPLWLAVVAVALAPFPLVVTHPRITTPSITHIPGVTP